MLILIRFIGTLMTIMGIISFLSPKILNQFVAFWKEGKRLYIAGIIRILIGSLLLLSASQCEIGWIIVILGTLFLVGGIVIFILGLERVKFVISWWDKKSPLGLRLFALFVTAIGILLIYSA